MRIYIPFYHNYLCVTISIGEQKFVRTFPAKGREYDLKMFAGLKKLNWIDSYDYTYAHSLIDLIKKTEGKK